KLDLSHVVGHLVHRRRMVRVRNDRPGINLSPATHLNPFSLERITIRAHGSRQPTKLLTLFATLHQQFTPIAAIPKLLICEVWERTREVNCLCHELFLLFSVDCP